jgi:hypothetical protein
MNQKAVFVLLYNVLNMLKQKDPLFENKDVAKVSLQENFLLQMTVVFPLNMLKRFYWYIGKLFFII